MQKSKQGLTALLLILCTTLILNACGRGSSNKDTAREQQEEQGGYQATLFPLNATLGGPATGLAEVIILGDELTTKVQIQNAPSGTHQQYIHAGRICPSAASDSNSDGVIDWNEALATSGGLLLPLDSNINDQHPSRWPGGRSYSYKESGSFVRLMAELRTRDTNPADGFVKLAPEDNINLEGRAVIVYDFIGPRKIPVACGIFSRVPVAPGVTPLPPQQPSEPPTVIIVSPSANDSETHPPLVPWNDAFKGQMIWANKCKGGETIQRQYRGRTVNYVCATNQWIVYVDKANVQPFIANLRAAPVTTPRTHAYYYIRPVTLAQPAAWDVVRNYWVKFSRNAAPVVLERDQF